MRRPSPHRSHLAHRDAYVQIPDDGGRSGDRRATLSLMSRAGIHLVSRRHVDLCRMSSAICPAG
ncbi:hypothetical protein E4099_09260 [Streptomyces palmae]|uniref:Uncharacterized protein n=1 Tax=Streptomyces palmae TaxID=1701085 RepID=A0A4Z0HBY6_9ACTN|nr:hypothetical protein E4099_09260 [Streptomyces palmae]